MQIGVSRARRETRSFPQEEAENPDCPLREFAGPNACHAVWQDAARGPRKDRQEMGYKIASDIPGERPRKIT